MGVGIFPVFNPPVPEARFESDGKLLSAQFYVLDEVCAELGIRAFSSFGDNREVPLDFDGDPDDLDELLGEWDEWFDPHEGLSTIEPLIGAIASGGRMAAKLAEPDNLLADLRDIERGLRLAASAGAGFRLEMF